MVWRHRKSTPSESKTKAIGERIGLISAAGTAIAVVAAGLKYVFGAFTPIELEITLPPIIEFRCSDPDFRPVACISRPEDRWHMTATAALHLRAVGDPSKEATITRATATVRNRQTHTETELTWLWSANLVPSADRAPSPEGRRIQVTGYSIKGGEARSHEMWFFPMDVPCRNLPIVNCPDGRKNFVEWVTFLRSLSLADPARPADATAYEVRFKFTYREDDKSKELPISCLVELSQSVRRMADMERNSRAGVLYVSAPCRPINDAHSTKWNALAKYLERLLKTTP